MTIPKLSEIKNWSPEIEKKITDVWKNSDEFKFNQKTKKKIYSIDTPPPYINTPIHIGHAITYSFMDMFARFKRMQGFEVLFPLGLDRNGLPIEMGTEKKYNISAFKMSREEFLKYCEKLLKETSVESTDTFAKLGISFNSYKEGKNLGEIYKTDSPEYRALTQSTFVSLYKKGLIYEDNRINNWDSKLQTTIADSEIEYKEIPSTFNDIQWTIKETGEKIIIGTTRPELICTCGMVIFNPEDKRYKHLQNKTAISPLFKKEIPIKAHPLTQIDKGTGLVMMCSTGDISDIQFFREMKLTPKIAINKNGTMNEKAEFLQDLKVKEARQKILEILKEKNLLIKQTQISHRTPISERSGAEVEFIEMPEFYLKQLEFKKEIKKIIDEINFFPEDSKKIIDNWIESVSIDWPISRRRFYATPIPLWYYEDLTAIPTDEKYYQPWKESPSINAEVIKNGKVIGKVKDFKNINWKGEERVLDTWFDSSISELFITKYKSDNKFFNKAYPVTLRPQGKEIVRTWLYYTLLRGFLEIKKPAFKDVWIHNHIVDEKGKKMSKSQGNVIDPQQIIKEFGAEALRFWSAIEGDLSKQDLSCSKEKIKAELKTINKILNITKFVLQFKKPLIKKICPLDKIFIDYIEVLTSEAEQSYEKYDFYHPSLKLREFIWEIFASHYIEIIKNRAYNEQKNFSNEESNSAKFTLYYLLKRTIILLYPIIPQLTTIIANELNIKLSKEEFPSSKKVNSQGKKISQIIEFNSLVWKTKKEKSVSLKEKISGISIPKEIKEFEKDLIACHNLE